jgi:hypothetical protein
MRRITLVAVALISTIGCGGEKGKSEYALAMRSEKKDEGGRLPESNDASRGTSAPLERKIIHDIDFDIVVTDFTDVPKKVDALMKEFDGAYVAQMALSGSEGQSRSGRWVVRVPLSGQGSFLERVRAFGEVTREGSKADDVSEEFYDLEARLKNKRETEARLLKVQQEKTGELKDILEVEQQIDRVRGEIEQMQGRLDRLTTLTSLSTITINIREIRNYKPPQAVSLGDRAAGTFDASVEALREFGEGALLFLIAIAPWLPILIAMFFLARYLIRRAVRNATNRVTGWWKARTAETQTSET